MKLKRRQLGPIAGEVVMFLIIVGAIVGFLWLCTRARGQADIQRTSEFVTIRWELSTGQTVEHIYRRSAITSIVQTNDGMRTSVVVGGHPYSVPVPFIDVIAKLQEE